MQLPCRGESRGGVVGVGTAPLSLRSKGPSVQVHKHTAFGHAGISRKV